MRAIGKKLITKINVSELIQEGSKDIYIGSDMILTSGAMDILRNRGIAIHYGVEKLCSGSTQEAKCDIRDLRGYIDTLLRKEYKIDDEKSIKKIVELVLENVSGMSKTHT